MTDEKSKANKQEIWIPAKFVSQQTIKCHQKWVINIDKQKIILPFEVLRYEETSKGYCGFLPTNIALPGVKSTPLKITSNLLITIFPKKKMPKGVKDV